MKSKYPLNLTPFIRSAPWGGDGALLPFLASLAIKKAKESHPLAELWYSAYPLAPSTTVVEKKSFTLHQLLHQQSALLLGDTTDRNLPFIIKILHAERAQPLHLHPNEAQAKAGMLLENQAHLAPEKRLFHDAFAKSELLYALDPQVEILAGFLPFAEIQERLELFSIASLQKMAQPFYQSPTPQSLQALLMQLFTLPAKEQQVLAQQILRIADDYQEIFSYASQIVHLAGENPEDLTLIMPLFLQHQLLMCDESILIAPQTPHLILRGLMVEISTPSDNMLPLASPSSHHPASFWSHLDLTLPQPNLIQRDRHNPDLPLSNLPFHIQMVHLEESHFINGKNQPLILLALKGKARLSSASGNRLRDKLPIDDIALTRGEAIFLPHEAGGYTLEGRGLFLLVWRL
ncbi:type I phosphomannose isomerase catalytic subunit [Entomospira culicis]|uniref:Phosphomannose isomerase type I catalytic domain-containing protein n=1 Tax=Entomospira culicis TaxID=2719989 RepID=A0A968KVZ4_9SPIO|nr:type I phosphomannose isomerase catalytic subunit [Entomospira culicis]NIZ18416.1 hypothetical protein [Entomospira culicis]NIZ68632.1 hypothetical protein [Entomospira culicis]WDI37232.1 hypothetical protein PVA46_00130 [Entomospira culicis]WDI38860.1 hypothetical protein PVA47_00140 [Entomospira culicis]